MDDQDRGPRLIAKDELNVTEFPFSLPCHRHPKSRKRIHVTEQGTDEHGRPVTHEWTVRASADFGLPLAIDEEVFLGATHLLHKAGFKDRRVHFTQWHFLVKVLGRSDGQADYRKLKQSLDRLRGAVIESKGTFYDKKSRCRVVESFNLIDSYTLYERDGAAPNDQPYLSSITFSEFLFRSFQEGFIKTLDLDFYLSIQLPIARKLFRYLDKHRYNGETYHVDLMKLADRLAITDAQYPSLARRHLESSHEELAARGFLRSVQFRRRGRSPFIVYTMAPPSEWRRDTRPVASKAAIRSVENPLVRELASRGVTRDVARELLVQHGEKSIADKIEVYDHLVSTKSVLVTKNPAGFLRQSIEKDFAPPVGYVSRAERQRRKEEEIAALERWKEETARQTAEREQQNIRMDALWASLADADRTAIEQEALSQLPPFAARNYHREKSEGRQSSGYCTWLASRNRILEERFLAPISVVPATPSTIEPPL